MHLLTPITDKFTKIVATGENCQKYKIGEYVLLDDLQYLALPFEIKGEKNLVKCILAREINVIGKYTPDAEETEVVLAAEKTENRTLVTDNTRDLNVIDNPGIDQGSYLKEEEENKQTLTT